MTRLHGLMVIAMLLPMACDDPADPETECESAADCNRDGKQNGTCDENGECVFPQVQILDQVELADLSSVTMDLDDQGRYLLPLATAGQVYHARIMASGGDGSYSWSQVAGDLPGGLSLAPSGLVAGTPGDAGTTCWTIRVESVGTEAEAGFCLQVAEASIEPKPWDEMVWDRDPWG